MQFSYTSDAFLGVEEGEIIDAGGSKVSLETLRRVLPRTVTTLMRIHAFTLPENPTIRDLWNALHQRDIPRVGITAFAQLAEEQGYSKRWCKLNALLYRLSGRKHLECATVLLPGSLLRCQGDRLAIPAVRQVAEDRFVVALDLETPLGTHHLIPA